MAIARLLQNLDQFRVVSRDLTRGSASGGFFTAIAYCIIILIFIAELGSYIKTSYGTNVIMDQTQETLVRINFDIQMYDLPCKFLKLQVFDKFGEERINSTENFKYISVGSDGLIKGSIYTQEEIAALEYIDAVSDVTEKEKDELNSDWSSTSDHFKHNDFDHVVSFHDFTFILFYADWCSHCRQFHPTWNKAVTKLSEKMNFKDGEGRDTTVKLLKVNCVDFQDLCNSAGIQAYPSLRLYKRDGTFEVFNKKRSLENLTSFVTESVGSSHLIAERHHNIFSEGCRVQGTIRVPRVPGHFHLQAEPFAQFNLNPSVTNVSHKVRHLSFGDRSSATNAARRKMPKEVVKHLDPLDGKSFTVERFHEAPCHYLKLVGTKLPDGPRFYQMTHSDRTRRLARDKNIIPQARFTYDFSPLSVVLTQNQKRWYEFLTSVFAIMGGTYTVIELFSGTIDTVSMAVKESLGKAN